MRIPSNASSSHHFARSPQADIQRSSFNRSHCHKTTFNASQLIPVFVDEVLPGDTFNLKMTALARLATPLVPIMDNLYLDSFFFFVPNRLVWDHWEEFNGYQVNPGDSTDFVIPTIDLSGGGFGIGTLSIYDYMGLDPWNVNTNYATYVTAGISPSVLPLRAYMLIWNEWFRDENLIPSVTIPTGDGPDSPTDYYILLRGKRHDYFTSCLPFPQKGPAVELPLGSTAPVVSTGIPPQFIGNTTSNDYGAMVANNSLPNYWYGTTPGTPAPPFGGSEAVAFLPGATGLETDLTDATAATINQLRQAFQIQKMYERDARGGTRYTEVIRAHFGVISPDMRLQRPEYLGGGSTPVVINPIAQTSASSTTPQANLAATGTAVAHGHGFVKSFTEHGYIIGMVSVRADLTYQSGINRMWWRQTRFDFFWPALSHIGEQAVLNNEIISNTTPTDVFGYQERYAEYRYKPSMVTGFFNTGSPAPIDFWHLAQYFIATPTLSQAFIEENVPMSRITAVTDPDYTTDFLFDSYFDLKCVRPMSVYGVPGLIDHF